ncbi:MAG: phage virion morphogenesis protein [Paludibacter sp.]|jgi:phage gpG-like protein|nr:phage virion morphogenesis protein [Paludibacter sp.]
MTPKEAQQKLRKRLADIERVRNSDVPRIIREEALNHYEQSFQVEGKIDDTVQPWPEVKRRDPKSPWYGFSLGATSPRPGSKKTGKKTNFSPTRAQDKILTGETNELKNSLTGTIKPDRVTISSDKPYSRVHNFGGKAYIFGKKEFTMKARQFIYPSALLNRNIREKIVQTLKQKNLL